MGFDVLDKIDHIIIQMSNRLNWTIDPIAFVCYRFCSFVINNLNTLYYFSKFCLKKKKNRCKRI